MKRYSNLQILLATCFLLLVAVSVTLLLTLLLRRSEPVKESVLALNVPYPILFIHGLGGEAKGWLDVGLVDYLQQKGLRFGGTVESSASSAATIEGGRFQPRHGDFFLIEISDPYQSLDLWVIEIGNAVREILDVTEAPRLVLVGHSAGGLAGRKYLTEHLNDHHVAKLVTIATPHRGSELALASRLKEELASRSENPTGLNTAWQGSLAALEKLEDLVGMKADSPLVNELVPEEYNDILFKLNRAEHPVDVEYGCILAVGSPPIADWKELQEEMRKLRERELASTIIERLSTAVMQGVTVFTEQTAQAGDGAVLLGSQNLANVDFFKKRSNLISNIMLIDSGHLVARARYAKILEAIEGPVKFLNVHIPVPKQRMIAIDYKNYLAGLCSIAATSSDGKALTASGASVYQRGDQAFGRVTIGPLPDSHWSPVEIKVRTIAGGLVFGKRIVAKGSAGIPLSMHNQEGIFDFEIINIWGIPALHPKGRNWDLIDPFPDLQLVISVDGSEKYRAEVYKNVNDYVQINQTASIFLKPKENRTVLQLWDVDPLGIPESMGSVSWNPGNIPVGRSIVSTETGISVQINISLRTSEDYDSTIWEPEPLRIDPVVLAADG